MKTLPALFSILTLSVAPLLTASPVGDPKPGSPAHTFAVGEKDFLLDGKPFVIRGGEIHYTRIPREYWRHRLKMSKAMGLNAVGVYLFWNYHEWEQGKFEWTGRADVAEFCRIAKEEGLWVILRPGPYVCSEWEMGGLPWWLLKHDDIKLRSTDPRFVGPMKSYLNEVGRVLAPLQVTRGGNILMVQVENEYGWFGKDAGYMGVVRDAIRDAGFDVPLYACNPQNVIQNGYREDIFQVVNFGGNGARKGFETLAKYQKHGPLMNGEYYPGWFDSWGHKHSVGVTGTILGDLRFMLERNYSFSIYMAHGGSNFGLWAGVCTDKPFIPISTSYDYDAPISEAGWATPRFNDIRDLFARHLQSGETIPDVPAPNPVIEIPAFTLDQVASLHGDLAIVRTDEIPRTMEESGQSRGVVLYRTTLPAGPAGVLSVAAVHDFAWVSVDGKQIGVLDRRTKRFRADIPARSKPAQLEILVEAMGRVNFGLGIEDRKGLHAPVNFFSAGVTTELRGWQVAPLELGEQPPANLKYRSLPVMAEAFSGPAFWRGSFHVDKPGDTFFDVRDWGKGVLWINGQCIGRFWNIGPTQTLYVPGPWLKQGRNEIVVLDLIGPTAPKFSGLARPILDQLRPELDIARRHRADGRFDVSGLKPAGEGAFTAEVQFQEHRLATPTKGRYFAIEAINAIDGANFAAIAELDVLDSAGEAMMMAKPGWRVLWVDSEEIVRESNEAENAIDGQAGTFWHSEWGVRKPGFPHRLVIDLGESQVVTGLRYLPRPGNDKAAGRIKNYRVYLSDEPFGLKLTK